MKYGNGSESVPSPKGGLMYVKSCPAFSPDLLTDYGNRFAVIRGKAQYSPGDQPGRGTSWGVPMYLPASIQLTSPRAGKVTVSGRVIFTTDGYVFIAEKHREDF